MANPTFRLVPAVVGVALLLGACTVKKQDTPALTGPSELATSINISVTPDVLSQDGASQSLVTITARDANGQLIRNLPLRAEIAVNGIITDFGTLSARNVVTDANGKATLIYTAPAAPAVSTDNGTIVQILVVPSGSDFGNATARSASIRLVPLGVVTPPNDLNASFTVSPLAPTEDNTVLFDASATVSQNPNSTIVSYTWDFGDGSTGSGKQVTHKYKAGTYTVVLTVKDSTNRTGTTRQNLTVSTPTTGLSAAFVFSPNPAQLNQPVHFDASLSTVNPPHRIVSYTWNFGEGTVRTTGDPRIDFVYTLPRTYVVVLTVTDDTGQTKTTTQSITPVAGS